MENIVMTQTDIYDALVKFLSNFKKDGAERKTIDYCRRKLEILETYWKDYQRNHRLCCEQGDFDHLYFKGNCYDKGEEVYFVIKNLIHKTMEQLYSKQSGVQLSQAGSEATNQAGSSSALDTTKISPNYVYGTPSGIGSNIGDMLKKQQINFRAFLRTTASIDVESLKSKWEYEDALTSLQSRWSAIDSLHWQIEGENGDEDLQYQEEISKYEDIYNTLKKTINSSMWSVTHRQHSTPKMDIPSFQGSYHQWTSFKDLFTEAIHKNPSLSNAQKMQFLKSKITGEAERLIHHLQISSENYEVCWEILNQRYSNRRLMFSSHINILLNLPTMQHQSVTMIKKLHDVTKECLHAIENLGVDIASWDPLLVHLLAQKLDGETFLEYIESIQAPRELPILQEFLDFLEKKFTALESSRRKQEVSNQKVVTKPAHPYQQTYQKRPFNSSNNYHLSKTNKANYDTKTMKTFHVTRSITCPLCNADHGLWMCARFTQLPDEQKLKTVGQLNCCINCLYSHFNKTCFSNKTCRKCNGKHNTLLHEAIVLKHKSAKTNHTTTNLLSSSGEQSTHVSLNDLTETLLATAMVKVTGVDGTQHTIRALIDQGSQISLITEKAAQILKLKRHQCKGKIFGVGEKANSSKGMMHIRLQSIYNDSTLEGSVIIMNSLIKSLPNKTFIRPSWPHIQNINLADPEFHISRPVDLLLGADMYSKIMLGGILRGDSDDLPIAQQTQLGWLLCGSVKPHYRCNVVLHDTKDLRQFWEIEDVHQPNELSTEDNECLQHFLSTTERLPDGRYQVRLPFKQEIKEQLGSTKPMALAQLRSLERKFEKNQHIKTEYVAFMKEYYTLEHMIPSIANMIPEYYLPHHCVTRDESSTTRLRVVYNAFARSLSGLSLNDILYRGPNLQQDLQELILRWRQFQFAYTADIEKMYRQIRIHPDDQTYQKILWRDTPNEPIQSYQLTTLTYGTKPAPFLAMMCLKQLALEEKQNFPESAKALEECFYMDDYCGGAQTITQANQLKLNLIALLNKGGFNLRKWASNEPQLLADLDKTLCNSQIYEFKQSDSTKTLGLAWSPQKDIFFIDIKLEQKSKQTKRSLLSDISKLFDPLGWLTPFSINMKTLFQKVWLSNLDWDDTLPENICSQGKEIKRDIPSVKTIEVNRWLGIRQNQIIQLHGFCDASNKAYAAVIYCKVKHGEECRVSLVAAKARLAPVSKVISTPRMELMGAQLLTQLMQKVQHCFQDYHLETYCWIDSTAVLGWIQGDPARWKPFVSNRVKSITSLIPVKHWRYVSTHENPADCASRGLTIKQLKEHTLWWHGPIWLESFENQHNIQQTIYQTNLETKHSILKQANTVTTEPHNLTITNIIQHLLNKFSCYEKITRIFAWILRLPTVAKVRQPYLTLQELRRSQNFIIKYVQQVEFADDLFYLQKHGKVHSKSKILNLNPVIDQEGILRVGGRLRNAHISIEMKHPIILLLPHNHIITTLITRYAHKLTFHGGARLTLSHIRQKYWVIGGYMATKKFIRQCITCRKQEPSGQVQLMGDLPSARVNPESAFYHCGVDYTGFVDVKANKGRGITTTKGSIALFICMVTKAVHLELVSDLTSSAFLAALKRMAARRGAPRHIYCDNGSNFVGANRMLQEEFVHLQKIFNQTFFAEITEMNIEFHFIASRAPHQGGLWERAVRSLKYHLKRVIGQQKLTFEEYTTLLANLEACLNSRPLCALTEDPEDIGFLTPAQFLSARPGLTVIETAEDARTRWHLTNKLFDDIWKRWKSEYLTQLSARNKWKNYQKNIRVGDLVIIHDEQLPAGKWPMGRVVEIHPGKDELVRVVTLKTKNGYLKRPIVKLSVLPLEQERGCEQNQQQKQSTSCLSIHPYQR